MSSEETIGNIPHGDTTTGSQPIYLDYNATTPLHPSVGMAMLPFLSGTSDSLFGNPSSSHVYGTKARLVVENARLQVAQLMCCQPDEILFTGCGSESNNYAIKGLLLNSEMNQMERERGQKRRHIITCKTEHVSVLEVCRFMEKECGCRVSYLDVDSEGFLRLDQLKQCLSNDTLLVTVMHANNETGTIQPIERIGEILDQYEQDHGIRIFLHCDASQSIGKVPIALYERMIPKSRSLPQYSNFSRVDLLTICPHKFYGPKGIGALFIRAGTVGGKLTKQIHGANHERNMRAGTENVILIAGLGKACEVTNIELFDRIQHMKHMRDRLYSGLVEKLGQQFITINGALDTSKRLPNTLNVSFKHVASNTLLDELGDQIAASAGAACHTDDVTISHVLESMNVDKDVSLNAIRLSTGRLLNEKDVDKAVSVISSAVKRLQPKSVDELLSGECEIDMNPNSIRLTSMTHGLGCGCKIRPQSLEMILQKIPKTNDPNVLVGTETSDDAGVYKLTDDIATVMSVDFFTPMVDDARQFGAIAATNALSDIYAMGGRPLTALNIVGFPVRRLPLVVLQEILLGAQEKCKEAGVSIVGGHSIEDSEIFFGQSVTGIVHPNKIWKNEGSKPGDVILLSKPIGVGIIATAMKRNSVGQGSQMGQAAVTTMSQLNKYVAELLLEKEYTVTACTDVTGFGLLGHMKEMVQSNNHLSFTVSASQVPIIEGVQELARIPSLVPGGTLNNQLFVHDIVHFASEISETTKIILCDAQTSGGLLFTVPVEQYTKLQHEFDQRGIFVKKIGLVEQRVNFSDNKQIQVIE